MSYKCLCRIKNDVENLHLVGLGVYTPPKVKAKTKVWDKISGAAKWILLILYLFIFISLLVTQEDCQNPVFIISFLVLGVIGWWCCKIFSAIVRFLIRHWIVALVILAAFLLIAFFG